PAQSQAQGRSDRQHRRDHATHGASGDAEGAGAWSGCGQYTRGAPQRCDPRRRRDEALRAPGRWCARLSHGPHLWSTVRYRKKRARPPRLDQGKWRSAAATRVHRVRSETGTKVRALGSVRTERYGRPGPVWLRAWPMVPILLFLSGAFLYPVAQLLWLSLFGGTGHLTIEHYQRLFRAPVYYTVLRNTLEIAGWTTVLCIIGGYPIAYLLATTTNRARNSLILWVLLPFWTSFLVRTFAWIVLLG